jgi:hypothetical protein
MWVKRFRGGGGGADDDDDDDDDDKQSGCPRTDLN